MEQPVITSLFLLNLEKLEEFLTKLIIELRLIFEQDENEGIKRLLACSTKENNYICLKCQKRNIDIILKTSRMKRFQ